jgi:hypothetical protein
MTNDEYRWRGVGENDIPLILLIPFIPSPQADPQPRDEPWDTCHDVQVTSSGTLGDCWP